MSPCAGCRVRHLICDARSTCSECKKGGRPCVRLNVRFRNLVCPSEKTTSTDQKKYEFHFDDEQTWIDTSGAIEFVTEDELDDGSSPTERLESDEFSGVSLDVLPRPLVREGQASSLILESFTESPAIQTPALDSDPPDYLTTSEPTPYDPPTDEFAGKLSTDPHMLYGLSARQLTWPLESLHEGKLLQHFITHIAPWVRRDVHTV